MKKIVNPDVLIDLSFYNDPTIQSYLLNKLRTSIASADPAAPLYTDRVDGDVFSVLNSKGLLCINLAGPGVGKSFMTQSNSVCAIFPLSEVCNQNDGKYWRNWTFETGMIELHALESNKRPLPFDIIMLDEIFQFGGLCVWYANFCLRHGKKLVLVGDPCQSPAVEPKFTDAEKESIGPHLLYGLKNVCAPNTLLSRTHNTANQSHRFGPVAAAVATRISGRPMIGLNNHVDIELFFAPTLEDAVAACPNPGPTIIALTNEAVNYLQAAYPDREVLTATRSGGLNLGKYTAFLHKYKSENPFPTRVGDKSVDWAKYIACTRGAGEIWVDSTAPGGFFGVSSANVHDFHIRRRPPPPTNRVVRTCWGGFPILGAAAAPFYLVGADHSEVRSKAGLKGLRVTSGPEAFRMPGTNIHVVDSVPHSAARVVRITPGGLAERNLFVHFPSGSGKSHFIRENPRFEGRKVVDFDHVVSDTIGWPEEHQWWSNPTVAADFYPRYYKLIRDYAERSEGLIYLSAEARSGVGYSFNIDPATHAERISKRDVDGPQGDAAAPFQGVRTVPDIRDGIERAFLLHCKSLERVRKHTSGLGRVASINALQGEHSCEVSFRSVDDLISNLFPPPRDEETLLFSLTRRDAQEYLSYPVGDRRARSDFQFHSRRQIDADKVDSGENSGQACSFGNLLIFNEQQPILSFDGLSLPPYLIEWDGLDYKPLTEMFDYQTTDSQFHSSDLQMARELVRDKFYPIEAVSGVFYHGRDTALAAKIEQFQGPSFALRADAMYTEPKPEVGKWLGDCMVHYRQRPTPATIAAAALKRYGAPNYSATVASLLPDKRVAYLLEEERHYDDILAVLDTLFTTSLVDDETLQALYIKHSIEFRVDQFSKSNMQLFPTLADFDKAMNDMNQAAKDQLKFPSKMADPFGDKEYQPVVTSTTAYMYIIAGHMRVLTELFHSIMGPRVQIMGPGWTLDRIVQKFGSFASLAKFLGFDVRRCDSSHRSSFIYAMRKFSSKHFPNISAGWFDFVFGFIYQAMAVWFTRSRDGSFRATVWGQLASGSAWTFFWNSMWSIFNFVSLIVQKIGVANSVTFFASSVLSTAGDDGFCSGELVHDLGFTDGDYPSFFRRRPENGGSRRRD